MVTPVSEADAAQVLTRHKLVMFKFSAKWCGPCRAVAPVIEKLAPQFPNVFVGEVDVDEAPETAQQHNVTAMPTFVFFKNGVEQERVRGADIAKITAALRTLNAQGDQFGQGSRLGSASSSARLETDDVRKARLRAVGVEPKPSASSEKSEKAEPKVAKPAKTSSAATPSIAADVVRYAKLYFATLFSLDARHTASQYQRA